MIKFTFRYIRKYYINFLLYLIISATILGMGLFSPYIESVFIDGLIYNPTYNFLAKMVVIILGISFMNTILSYLQNIILIKLNSKSSFQMSNDIINHLKKVNIITLSKFDSAYLSNRINSDSDSLISFLLTNAIKFFSNIIILIFCSIWLLINFDTSLILLIMSVLPLYIATYFILKKPLYRERMKLLENQGFFFAILNRTLRCLKTIKTKVLFEESEKLYCDSFTLLFKSILSFNRISYIFSSLNNICNSVLHIVILIFTGVKIIEGELTIGEFTLISSYCNMIVSSITYFLSLGESFQSSKVSYSRIMEFMSYPMESNGYNKLDSIYEVNIKDICFSYSSVPVINKFSCKLEKGNIYSLIGANGTGKSTLVDLILGLLERNSGSILYNNTDISELDMYKTRKELISTVQQEPYLSVDTIYNNLTYNLKEIDNEILYELLNKFNLLNKINSFPDKFETIVNDNIKNLSGGERQKIAIINAVLSNSDILILDEPTSALDSSSINMLKEILITIKSEKIIIIISHDEDFYKISDTIISL